MAAANRWSGLNREARRLDELIASEKEYTDIDQQIDDVIDDAANEKQARTR
jgi:hypothetical protein